MTVLKIIGQNVHLSVAEQEWFGVMQRMYGCTEHEALEEILAYKREMAFMHEKEGNFALARQLLQEIDEWDDTREEEYKQRKTPPKIII